MNESTPPSPELVSERETRSRMGRPLKDAETALKDLADARHRYRDAVLTLADMVAGGERRGAHRDFTLQSVDALQSDRLSEDVRKVLGEA